METILLSSVGTALTHSNRSSQGRQEKQVYVLAPCLFRGWAQGTAESIVAQKKVELGFFFQNSNRVLNLI